MFAILFGLVYASAGIDRAQPIDGAQPIDYHEECNAEGCSREEVKELWSTFHHECFVETCWMEEVGEDAGSRIAQRWDGTWYFTNPAVVDEMMSYFVDRLGHKAAWQVKMKPGLTNTFWQNLIRMVLNKGVTVGFACYWDEGGVYDCDGDVGL